MLDNTMQFQNLYVFVSSAIIAFIVVFVAVRIREIIKNMKK
jgi:hypothetical protein